MPGFEKDIKYAIATGHHITTKVAENILQGGGNAFDATVAVFLAMTITEPAMCSMFAGGFANIFTAEKGNQVIDFFAQTPINKSLNNAKYDRVEVDFGQSQETYYAGPASMSVTGAAKMIHYFVKHHCRMDLKELVRQSQQLAKEGVTLTNFQATDLRLLKDIFGLQSKGKELFFDDGVLKKEGDVLHMSAYADFLESFAREQNDWIYRGEIAQSIVTYCADEGGFLSMDDFEEYQLEIRNPFKFSLEDHWISTPGLPSLGGGLMYLFSQHLFKQKYPLDSPAYFKQIIEAFDICTPFTKDGAKLFNYIEDVEQYRSTNIIPGGTSHFNILDQWGNAVAMSVSLGEGSGYFIPDTDIQMNNMLGETALMPDGLNSWQTNQRLNSMMCPTLVFDRNNQLELLTGTGGATRIPFSIGQMLYSKYKLNRTLDHAIHSPRVYKNDHVCYVEKGISVKEEIVEMEVKVWDELELLFGGTHSIDSKAGHAIGDRRREGSAVTCFK